MPTNKERFLHAANWALENERNGVETGINIRTLSSCKLDFKVTLFNTSKGLLYDGFSAPEQELLKGLIVLERNGIAEDVLACAFRKFYNYGEPLEKNQHQQYLDREDIHIFYKKKEDGVNIRPYFNPVTSQVEFATRGTLLGLAETEENAMADFGQLARDIATAKYQILLNKDFVKRYSCVFEMIHPDTKILTDYGDRKDLILLAVFDLVDGCRELSEGEMSTLAIKHRIWMVDRWYFSPTTKYFDEDLVRLQKKWADTDHEGTVAVFTDTENVPLYRLKIKNKKYLEMLRIARFCTMKNTRALIEEYNLESWEDLRAHLYATYSEMSEELEMGYLQYFNRWFMWTRQKYSLHIQLTALYNYECPKLDTPQAEYAAFVQNKYPQFAGFLFLLRKQHQKTGMLVDWDKSEKAQRMIEKFLPLEKAAE